MPRSGHRHRWSRAADGAMGEIMFGNSWIRRRRKPRLVPRFALLGLLLPRRRRRTSLAPSADDPYQAYLTWAAAGRPQEPGTLLPEVV